MQQAYPDFNLENKVDFEGGGNVTSGNNTRKIKEMGRERNNKEVSSDAMIVDNRKSTRMEGQFTHEGLCVKNIIKYIVIERRGKEGSCCILFLLSIISECYLFCSNMFVFF